MIEDLDMDSSENIKVEFDERKTNLEIDITHVNNMMRVIQKYITETELNIQTIKQVIKTELDSAKKAKLYAVLNISNDQLIKFHDLYHKYIHSKYYYRNEQDDFSLKRARLLEVDLKRATSGELSPAKLIQVLQAFSSNKSNSLETEEDLLPSDNDLYKM